MILINGVCVIMPNRVLVKLAVFVRFASVALFPKCRQASLLLLFFKLLLSKTADPYFEKIIINNGSVIK